MAYKWQGMKKLSWGEVKKLHENGGLAGYFMLYPDGSEGQIENGYDWRDIEAHHLNGGDFGTEKKITDCRKQNDMKNELDAIAGSIAERLLSEGFIIQRYDACTTDSIYLKLDYGVCNSIRISSHTGKKHLKYRYNIGSYIDEFHVAKDKYDRFYYPADKMEDMIAQIMEDREIKLSQYGYESYAGYMVKNKRDKSDSPGFWREAVLLGGTEGACDCK